MQGYPTGHQVEAVGSFTKAASEWTGDAKKGKQVKRVKEAALIPWRQ
jgi:hypothetical protein